MIYVIADDLTGAAEIAGVCLRYNIPVSFGIDCIPNELKTVTIIATDSRSLTENEAYQAHLNLAKQIVLKEGDKVFKKCDSVLRGFVVSELSALMERFHNNRVLLQPANPKTKRCIKDATYYVNDVSIEKSGFSTDPDFPAKYSNVKAILLHNSRLNKADKTIFLGTINKVDRAGIFIPDCGGKEDLEHSISLYNEGMLIGGSAAFFECFIDKVGLGLVKAKDNAQTFQVSKNYVLVSGSTFPESLRFAEHLEHSGCKIMVFPRAMLQPKCSDDVLRLFVQNVITAYQSHKKLVLRISKENIKFKQSSIILKQRLSVVLKQILSEIELNDLFIEGGATAYDVLKTLGWTDFTPIQELDIGVIRLVHNVYPKLHVTIKPGSYFWPKDVLN